MELATHLTGIVHEEDRTRPVAGGFNSIESGYNGFQKAVDVVGYNYKPQEYTRFRARNPNIPLIASETSSCVSTRGEYFFPVSNDKSQGQANFQVSSYDLYAPRWAMPPDTEFVGQETQPFVAGEFVWTGFDYLGEPTPYNSDSTNLLNFQDPVQRAKAEQELKELGKMTVPSRSSYFGIDRPGRFQKRPFYLYQAHWRPDYPMAHILPHWTWPERVGQVTPVHVLHLGRRSRVVPQRKIARTKTEASARISPALGRRELRAGRTARRRLQEWREWAEDVVKTAGAPAKIILEPDHKEIAPDGTDLSFVSVSVVDGAGTLVPKANQLIHFAVVGPAEIAAVDNGDPTSFEPFQASERKLFNGRALVILRSRAGTTGEITLAAEADGLPKAITKVQAVAPVARAAAVDDRPVENAAVIPSERVRDPSLPTLFLVGDSTVKVGTRGQRGWGEEFAHFFDTTKINVVNRAIGGRSSRTFQTEGRWDNVLADMKSGDFMIVQFGHNDGGAVNDTTRARASLKGGGDETEEIDNLLTKKHEVVHTYGWYMRKYASDTKAKGATPIICSLIPRKIWKDGKIQRATADYGGWAQKAAERTGAYFVDLNEVIAQTYDSLGEDKVNMLFADEHTHTTVAGAQINAACVIAGLKGLKDDPLGKYFSADAQAIEAFPTR